MMKDPLLAVQEREQEISHIVLFEFNRKALDALRRGLRFEEFRKFIVQNHYLGFKEDLERQDYRVTDSTQYDDSGFPKGILLQYPDQFSDGKHNIDLDIRDAATRAGIEGFFERSYHFLT